MFGKKTGDTLGYSKVQTVIGEGTVLNGTLQSSGTLRLDGRMEGTIEHAGELIVGPKGQLIANVRAKAMAVAGEVRGDLVIDGKLELLTTAQVYGDIKYGRLIIHEGAVFKGRSETTSLADPSESAPVTPPAMARE